jgi:hypothetical protein
MKICLYTMIAIAIVILVFVIVLNGSKKAVQLGFQCCQMVFQCFSCLFTTCRGQSSTVGFQSQVQPRTKRYP